MDYKGHKIEDELVQEHSELIEVFELQENFIDLNGDDINRISELLVSKSLDKKSGVHVSLGATFKDPRIRIYIEEGYRDRYDDWVNATATVKFVWLEGETPDERSKRIEMEKYRIDREIEKRQKEQLEQEQKNKARRNRKIEDAIKVLSENGYTISKK